MNYEKRIAEYERRLEELKRRESIDGITILGKRHPKWDRRTISLFSTEIRKATFPPVVNVKGGHYKTEKQRVISFSELTEEEFQDHISVCDELMTVIDERLREYAERKNNG